MFRFEIIAFLALAAAIIPMLLIHFFWSRWRNKSLQRFADGSLLVHFAPEPSAIKSGYKLTAMLLAALLLAIGIANPQFGSRMEDVQLEGSEIIIALDVSNSMLASDFPPDRLTAAKRAISRMIAGLRNDRLGIVVFAGQSYVQLPLTNDYATARLFLESIEPGMVPLQGTAIGSAIELAMESFDKKSKSGKAIIVISDGENHQDQPEEAATLAAAAGISVHTIGIGSEEGVPIPYLYNGKKTGFHKDRDGNTVVSHLDATSLKAIANAGKGFFVLASDGQVGLDLLLKEIQKMKKASLEEKRFTSFESHFQIFLFLALLLLLTEACLGERKTGKFRNWITKQSR